MLARESVSITPGENRMTISFRLFGYTVSFSIAKLIKIPSERLDHLILTDPK